MATARYVIGVLLVISMPPGIAWWYLVHPLVGFWRRRGVRVTLWVVGTLAIGAMAALFTVRDALLGRDLGGQPAVAGLGLVLLIVAIVMGWRRRRYLTPRILAGVPELDASGMGGELLQEGPYAVIRHPRYVEVAFAVFAYACFSNFVGAYVLALATLPALHGVVLLEEHELSQRFDAEYEDYRARVPRYVPRRPGLRGRNDDES